MDRLQVLKHYLRFRFGRFASRDKLVAWQERRIRQHLEWVSGHSPFYAGFAGKPLSDWPVMNKALMMEHFDQLNTVNVTKQEAFDFAYGCESQRAFSSTLRGLTVGLSSGTSGRRGIFLASPSERALWAGAILGKMLPDMLWSSHRIALFLRAGSTLYDSVSSRRLSFRFYDLASPMSEHIANLNAYKPDIIFAPGTMIGLLAEQVDTLAFRPKRIVACAEVLYPDVVGLCEERLGVSPEQIYQCTEGFLGCTQRGSFQFNEDLVHIEPDWLDKERTCFRPIITDFSRTSQPIIRYMLDDIIRLEPEARGVFQQIGRVEGRCDDILQAKGTDGKAVKLFPDYLVRRILFTTSVSDFKIEQAPDFALRVRVATKYRVEIAQAIREHFTTSGAAYPEIFWAEPEPWDPLAKRRRIQQVQAFS